jgi:hypothetical protein
MQRDSSMRVSEEEACRIANEYVRSHQLEVGALFEVRHLLCFGQPGGRWVISFQNIGTPVRIDPNSVQSPGPDSTMTILVDDANGKAELAIRL